ncbi:M48 family metallopeptidase [Candidatus Micrarchaeota archaeon]|nr:M48 family metallopeptidase [Candidatus Micrarchaeota archaeon]
MEEIELIGTKFFIIERFTSNKNANARLKGNEIVISIPSRWPAKEKERIKLSLQKSAIKAIEKGKWKVNKVKKAKFYHGQKVKILEKQFEIVFKEGVAFQSKILENQVEITLKEHPEKDEIASFLVRKEVTNKFFDQLLARVEEMNKIHFQGNVSKLTIRDNFSRWGSCSRDGSISLNFKLLFMPSEILDYVIVHELAHTKYRNHGPRFWGVVEKVMPEYHERRKWLRQNGDKIFEKENRTEKHMKLADMNDEKL